MSGYEINVPLEEVIIILLAECKVSSYLLEKVHSSLLNLGGEEGTSQSMAMSTAVYK